MRRSLSANTLDGTMNRWVLQKSPDNEGHITEVRAIADRLAAGDDVELESVAVILGEKKSHSHPRFAVVLGIALIVVGVALAVWPEFVGVPLLRLPGFLLAGAGLRIVVSWWRRGSLREAGIGK